MRRRAAEYRRPTKRRLAPWIWISLAVFSIAGLALFVIHHKHAKNQLKQIVMDKKLEEEPSSKEDAPSVHSFSRQLTEQMIIAKAYVIIAKERNNLHLAWEMNKKIRTCQLLLSNAAMRGKSINLEETESLISSMSDLIYKAQDAHYDIATTIMTMKSHIQALEDRATAATIQSVLFAQVLSESFPKSLHCFHVKLTADWLSVPTFQHRAKEIRNSPKLVDKSLYHFCIFSDNVLATSVVINSTACNAEHPEKLVFHIVTNGVTYGAMQAWFFSNDFKGATVEVTSLEDLSWLNASYSPIVRQLLDENSLSYYFGNYGDSKEEAKLRNPKHLSLLNNLRFYIPEIYPHLEKITLLDDDVVVQKDLTEIFHIDLHGNVNGAVETCLESYHRFHKYLNFSNPIISSRFDPQACGWAFGLNVFDIISWRRANVTARYHYWQEQNADRTLWKLGTLPPALLSFYGLVEPLDRRWHVLGLGYDINVDNMLIESGAVLHYNGNLKPWLRLGLSRYKPFWERYVHTTHPYYRDCVAT